MDHTLNWLWCRRLKACEAVLRRLLFVSEPSFFQLICTSGRMIQKQNRYVSFFPYDFQEINMSLQNDPSHFGFFFANNTVNHQNGLIVRTVFDETNFVSRH